MTLRLQLRLKGAKATERWGYRLGKSLAAPFVIYLKGDLGSGKTTLARAILRARGVKGAVRSPTYTLLEMYDTEAGRAYHLDLYRLSHPGELEYLALRDLLAEPAIWLVEWPERGEGELPAADVIVELNYDDGGRVIDLIPLTDRGRIAVEAL